MMGMGEKKPKYIQKQRKNPPFGCPPIPPSIKLEADCFPGRKEPKTSRTYPRWGRDPNLQGSKEIRGRARYGLIQTGNMIFYTYECSRSSVKAGWDTG